MLIKYQMASCYKEGKMEIFVLVPEIYGPPQLKYLSKVNLQIS